MTSSPRPPAGLGAAGRALWRRLADEFEFGARELALLETAGRQADDVAALEALIAEQGMTVPGSAGQPRLNAAVTEVRQGRLALGKLLGTLALPDEEGEQPVTEPQRRGRRAAQVRWAKRDLQRERAADRSRDDGAA